MEVSNGKLERVRIGGGKGAGIFFEKFGFTGWHAHLISCPDVIHTYI